MEFNVNLQLAGLLEWMDQQMKNCGGKTAVIGISGGKDSSTVAALAVAAYGRENVYGVVWCSSPKRTRSLPTMTWHSVLPPPAASKGHGGN